MILKKNANYVIANVYNSISIFFYLEYNITIRSKETKYVFTTISINLPGFY